MSEGDGDGKVELIKCKVVFLKYKIVSEGDGDGLRRSTQLHSLFHHCFLKVKNFR